MMEMTILNLSHKFHTLLKAASVAFMIGTAGLAMLMTVSTAEAQEAKLDLSFDASTIPLAVDSNHCEIDLGNDTYATPSVLNKTACPIELVETEKNQELVLNEVVEAVVSSKTVTTARAIARPKYSFGKEDNISVKLKVDPRKDEIVKVTFEWKTD